jgi:mannitol-specific phosphotransferase system IIBC component
MKETIQPLGSFMAGVDQPNFGTCIARGLIMDNLTTI